jgi:hypothetical protein
VTSFNYTRGWVGQGNWNEWEKAIICTSQLLYITQNIRSVISLHNVQPNKWGVDAGSMRALVNKTKEKNILPGELGPAPAPALGGTVGGGGRGGGTLPWSAPTVESAEQEGWGRGTSQNSDEKNKKQVKIKSASMFTTVRHSSTWPLNKRKERKKEKKMPQKKHAGTGKHKQLTLQQRIHFPTTSHRNYQRKFGLLKRWKCLQVNKYRRNTRK